MAAITAAAIAGGVGLIGDFMSSSGQSATNAANLQIAQMNNAFNAQQAALNRQFQASQVTQQEQFQEQMSDTAMQRRMQDLKNAGLNPLLAVGQGGASQPTGTAAGGSSAQSAGNPQMLNTMASFAQAGQQAANAAQTYSNIKLQNAQAAKTASETPTPQYVETSINPDGSTSLEVNANAGHELGDQQLASQKAAIAKINSDIGVNASTISLNEALEVGRGLDNQLVGDTLTALVKARNASANLEQITSNSGAKVMGAQAGNQNLGTWIEALRLILGASKGH